MVPPANDISTSFVAVALALLVLALLEVALGAVVVVGVGDVALVVGVVDVGTAAVLLVPAGAGDVAAVVGAGETGVVLPGPFGEAVVVTPLCVGDALPEPLTVTALTVVDPDALKVPAPLLVALTVVDPDALVTALCAITSGLPSAALSKAALTAVASVLFENRFFIVIRSPFERTS
jgi:hypothetical protein